MNIEDEVSVRTNSNFLLEGKWHKSGYWIRVGLVPDERGVKFFHDLLET